MRRDRVCALVALFLIPAFAVGAQAQKKDGFQADKPGEMPQMGRGEGRHFKSELMALFYPIGMIKHHAEEIKLTDAQLEKLRKLSDQTNAEIEKISSELDRELKALVKLIKQNAPQKKVLAQMDKVFEYENAIKKKHTIMMIAIRNVLTAKQREILDKIKAEHRFHRGRHHHGGPPPSGPPCQGSGGPPPGPPPGGGPTDAFLYMIN